MVKAAVQYFCGCGFKSGEAGDAISHVRDTKHTVSVNGEIKETEKKS